MFIKCLFASLSAKHLTDIHNIIALYISPLSSKHDLPQLKVENCGPETENHLPELTQGGKGETGSQCDSIRRRAFGRY